MGPHNRNWIHTTAVIPTKPRRGNLPYRVHMYPGQGGSILFVLLSKVTILMKPLVNKSWYTELVLYLICLAMGTMLAAISFQLIPEGNIVCEPA